MEIILAEEKPPSERLGMLRNCLRFVEQVGDTDDLTGLNTANSMREIAAAHLSELLQQESDKLSATEVREARAELQSANVWNLVWELACRTVPNTTPPTPQRLAIVMLIATGVAMCLLPLGTIALVAGLTSRVLRRPADPRPPGLGIARQAVCWIFAVAASVVLFGLAPAQIVPISVQQTVGKVLMAALPPVIVIAYVVFVLRPKRWQFNMRQLMIVLPIAGALLLVGMTIHRAGYHVPGRSVDGVAPPALATILAQAGFRRWETALLQWNAYRGSAVAIALALALIGCWSWYRSQHGSALPTSRWQWPARVTVGQVGCSAAYAAVLVFVVELAVAPTILRGVEANYDSRMAWFEDLHERRAGLAENLQAIESDPARMKEIREQAERMVISPTGA